MKSHNLPLGDKQGQDYTATRLGTYSNQLQAAELARKDAEAAYTSAEQTRNTSGIWAIPQVQSNPTVVKLREKIGELEEQKAALLVNYTEEWPAVQKINKQLKALHDQLDRAPGEIVNGLEATL